MKQATIDRSTGIVRWYDGMVKGEVAEMPAPSVRGLDRAVRIAQQERRGLVSLMSSEEIRKAELSRSRQIVIYPDGMPETEESRIRGMRILHANKRRETQMGEPIVNTATGAVKFPKPEEKKAAAPTEEMAYVAIPKATMTKLTSLARKDGWVPDAETDRGKANQASKAAKVYVLLGIDMLIAKRAS